MNPPQIGLIVALAALSCAAKCGREPRPIFTPQPVVPVPKDLGQRAYAHVAKIVGLGPRPSGSAASKQSLDYLAGELKKLGLKPRLDKWLNPIEKIEFANLIVTIPGRHPDKIVLGCHHDTKLFSGHPDPKHNFRFVGANDGGSGCGLLVALAAEILAQKRPITYDIVLFDGEESLPVKWNVYRALFGSRKYVRNYKKQFLDGFNVPRIRGMVLLDMVGARDLSIDEETSSNSGLRRLFFAAAQARGHQIHFFQNKHLVNDDHTAFLKAGIPAINLIDLYDNPQWHTPQDTLANMSARSLQIVGEVVLQALPAMELMLFPDVVNKTDLEKTGR